MQILDELPTQLGIALWVRYRDLLLWTSTPVEARVGLFAEDGSELTLPLWTLGEAAPLEVARALKQLAHVVTGPATMASRGLIDACQRIAEWAEQEAYNAVEFHYSDLAARIDDSDPELAYAAGRAARRHAAYERAVAWFQRALGLARRQRHWAALVDSFLAWGSLEAQRGRPANAERLYLRASRAARKRKLDDLGAAAHHDLLALKAQQYRFFEAQQHGMAALQLYSFEHPRFPYLAHDLAELWAWQGYYAAALPVLQQSLRILTAPSEAFQIQANIARAAAGSGDVDAFYAAWKAVEDAVRYPAEYAASALINVAEGAFLLGLLRQAMELATKGTQIARTRNEAGEERRALALMERISSGKPPAIGTAPPEDVLRLRDELLQLLAKRSGT